MTLSVSVSQHHRSPLWFCSSFSRRTRDSTPAPPRRDEALGIWQRNETPAAGNPLRLDHYLAGSHGPPVGVCDLAELQRRRASEVTPTWRPGMMEWKERKRQNVAIPSALQIFLQHDTLSANPL